MSQMRTFSWTNPAAAVARNLNVGFEVAEITTTDTTNGASWFWMDTMDAASFQLVDTGAITTTNGFTPLAQSVAYGATVSGFTNANPGVITVNDTATFGYAAGDTINVVNIADDLSAATSLNGTYTVASVTATTITLDQNTAASSVWVSGGTVIRVSDTNGDPVRFHNQAIQGITLGTGVVGGNNAVMVAVVKGQESVV